MTSRKASIDQRMAAPNRLSLWWSGLQVRMTISYTLTSLVAMLVIELLLASVIWLALNYSGLADNEIITAAKDTARLYALEAAIQGGGDALDPRSTFEIGQPFSIAPTNEANSNRPVQITYLPDNPADQQVIFALLIMPNGKVLASSYPARYPAMKLATELLPDHAQFVTAALAGTATNGSRLTAQGREIWVIEPIWGRTRQIIGSLYLQIPVSQKLLDSSLIPGFVQMLLVSSIFWLVMMLPVGGLFGLMTTRGLLRRLQKLVTATTRFADGDYTQRVKVSRRDEVGQLEAHFNRMAEQLVESISQQQRLAEENARLAERNRIARDLHDSIKQQLFAVSMQLGSALTLIEHHPDTARLHVQEADSLAYHAQQELTTLIQELRPLSLQSKALEVALEEYVITWGRQQRIAVDIHLAKHCTLSPLIEEAFWRVTQESLSNIARHSGATQIQFLLTCEQCKATLTIVDNGQGFDATLVSNFGVGLNSMRERMEALRGRITVQSNRGQGTRIIAQCGSCEAQEYTDRLATPTS